MSGSRDRDSRAPAGPGRAEHERATAAPDDATAGDAAGGDLSAIDAELARLIHRLALAENERDSDGARVMRSTAALVSRERGRGHPCVELPRWAGVRIVATDASSELPDVEAWTAVLRSSALVGDGDAPTPLVLRDTRCYLYRYWRAEKRLGERIRADAGAAGEALDVTAAASSFRTLFPRPRGGNVDRQAVAAAAVLRNRLTIVSGGPGTGKTSTVARILALHAACDARLRVVLAAPTGKAAARLTQAIADETRRLGIAPPERADEREAKTIHRTLGYRMDTGRFRHDAARPLACDLLVVDEASMIDLLLMDALFAAVPPHARIVLVGDKDQLASVEAGFVFGDLCDAAAAAGGFSTEFAEFFRALAGYGLQADASGAAPAPMPAASHATAARADHGSLGDCGVELTVGWRFREHPAIEKLAAAVRSCDAGAALAVLDDPAQADTCRHDLPSDPVEVVRAVRESIDAVRNAPTPEEALQRLRHARILCATNRGRWGVATLNLLVERELADRGTPTGGRWYPGRPILVTENDYTIGLFNGDVGVCFPDASGGIRAWFEDARGLREVSPAKLPDHETAWAMTVHKSQGSEFDRVVFVLPARDSPLLTRELVYTAVTRARTHVTIFAPQDLLRAAIARRAERVSGLRDLLTGTAP